MMEAANAGAASVEGAKSVGMGISLPFEAGLNPSVMPELGFEFHYFFTRKFFMIETMRVTPNDLPIRWCLFTSNFVLCRRWLSLLEAWALATSSSRCVPSPKL